MVHRLAFLLLALLTIGGAPARAQSAGSLEQALVACEPGTDPQPAGPAFSGQLAMGVGITPRKVTGFTSVSPAEARCLMVILGSKLKVLHTIDDPDRLPGAITFRKGALEADTPANQAAFEAELASVITADKSTPLLIYCHGESCPFSYNISLRASRAGFQNVFWLREGNLGWQRAGYSFMVPDIKTVKRRREDCDKELQYRPIDYANDFLAYFRHGSMEQVDAEVALGIRHDRKSCLQSLIKLYEWSAADRADLERLVTRSDLDGTVAFEAARTVVLSDPLKYLELPEGATVEWLREQVLISQKIIESPPCHTFEYDRQIPTSNSELEQLKAEITRYGACLETKIGMMETLNQYKFEDTVRWIQRVRPLTCRNWRTSTCIANDLWDSLDAFVSTANSSSISAAGNAVSGQLERLEREHKQLLDWVN